LKNKGKVGYKCAVIGKTGIGIVGKAMKIININGAGV
jgi:hypothetical protein